MKKLVLLVAVAILAQAPRAASAESLNYTFTGYCDGVSLDVTNNAQYAGTHDGGCEAQDPIGGFKVKVGGVPFKIAYLATVDTKNAPGRQLIYWLNLQGLGWELFVVNGGAVSYVKSGTLTIGNPDPNSTAAATAAGL